MAGRSRHVLRRLLVVALAVLMIVSLVRVRWSLLWGQQQWTETKLLGTTPTQQATNMMMVPRSEYDKAVAVKEALEKLVAKLRGGNRDTITTTATPAAAVASGTPAGLELQVAHVRIKMAQLEKSHATQLEDLRQAHGAAMESKVAEATDREKEHANLKAKLSKAETAAGLLLKEKAALQQSIADKDEELKELRDDRTHANTAATSNGGANDAAAATTPGQATTTANHSSPIIVPQASSARSSAVTTAAPPVPAPKTKLKKLPCTDSDDGCKCVEWTTVLACRPDADDGSACWKACCCRLDFASPTHVSDLRTSCASFKARFTPSFEAHLQLILGLLAFNGATPMPDGGVLLGVFRHGMIVPPWDDDVDFVIDIEGRRTLLNEKGWRLRETAGAATDAGGASSSSSSSSSSVSVRDVTDTPLGKELRDATFGAHPCSTTSGHPDLCRKLTTVQISDRGGGGGDSSGGAGSFGKNSSTEVVASAAGTAGTASAPPRTSFVRTFFRKQGLSGPSATVCVSFLLLKWGFIQALVHPKCRGAGGKYMDVFAPACSGRMPLARPRGTTTTTTTATDGGGNGAVDVKVDLVSPAAVEECAGADWSLQSKWAGDAWNAVRPYSTLASTGAAELRFVTVGRAGGGDGGNSAKGGSGGGVVLLAPNRTFAAAYLEASFGPTWAEEARICPHAVYKDFKECASKSTPLRMAAAAEAMGALEECAGLLGALPGVT